MTIAQQLNITTFPFEIKDNQGRVIYHEFSDGFWWKCEYNQNGNEIYYENSIGCIEDNRPKPESEPKQETLEEFKKRFANDESHKNIKLDYQDGIYYGIGVGAEWQAERMYSEEEVQLIASKLLTDIKNGNAGNSVEWFEQFKKKGGDK